MLSKKDPFLKDISNGEELQKLYQQVEKEQKEKLKILQEKEISYNKNQVLITIIVFILISIIFFFWLYLIKDSVSTSLNKGLKDKSLQSFFQTLEESQSQFENIKNKNLNLDVNWDELKKTIEENPELLQEDNKQELFDILKNKLEDKAEINNDSNTDSLKNANKQESTENSEEQTGELEKDINNDTLNK